MKPKQLLVIGDSGVYGWGDREAGGWCERLRRDWMQLPAAPVIYPLGVRGDGLERVAARWRSEWQCRGELRRQTPEGVLLAVGLNDTARVGRPDGRQQLNLEAYGFGMGQLLNEMKAETQVLVIGLTPVDEHVMPFADCLWYSNEDVAAHEAVLAETCRDADIPFLPLHRSMLEEPDWLTWMEPDGLHLNGEGHHFIHRRIRSWTALQTWAELLPLTTTTPVLG